MRFIVEWTDESGDADRDIIRTEDIVEEVLESVTNMLEGEVVYDDHAADEWHREHPGATEGDTPDFEVPALQALLEQETSDGDLPRCLAGMKDGAVIELKCDSGKLKIIRDR